MRTISFRRIIDGRPIDIFAEGFTFDPSVGVGLGPEEVWAVDENEKDFNLTEEQIEQYGKEATEVLLSIDN